MGASILKLIIAWFITHEGGGAPLLRIHHCIVEALEGRGLSIINIQSLVDSSIAESLEGVLRFIKLGCIVA